MFSLSKSMVLHSRQRCSSSKTDLKIDLQNDLKKELKKELKMELFLRGGCCTMRVQCWLSKFPVFELQNELKINLQNDLKKELKKELKMELKMEVFLRGGWFTMTPYWHRWLALFLGRNENHF